MEEAVAKLKQWVEDCDNIVFFGGAGVSTESGIPDFRSVDGLYNQKYKYPPETILSHSFFERYPEEYYRFHHEKLRLLRENRRAHSGHDSVRGSAGLRGAGGVRICDAGQQYPPPHRC